ncbi:MAG: hypothetical protein GY778_02715 [bacterium]|nr:hypothetical protein [bacterium]
MQAAIDAGRVPASNIVGDTVENYSIISHGLGIPFMMIGNLYAWAGSQYEPAVLDGQNFDEIVDAVADPNTDIAREVGNAANYLTAMICQLTGGQPESVCSTPLIAQAQAVLSGA